MRKTHRAKNRVWAMTRVQAVGELVRCSRTVVPSLTLIRAAVVAAVVGDDDRTASTYQCLP